MKRMIIAIAIVLAILCSGSYSLWKFHRLRMEATPLIETMDQAADNGALEQAHEAAQRFWELWMDYEPDLVRFARRDPLEEIGRCAARLTAFAAHGEEAEFAAAVNELEYGLKELWESEFPSVHNLF